MAIRILLTLLLLAPLADADDEPKFEMPQPQKEHAWLAQFQGDWETTGQCAMPDGSQSQTMKGHATGEMIGGFWVKLASDGEMDGMHILGILTLGYDPEARQYIGTWTDSCSSHLWTYEGSVDESGKTLTLRTEGPNMTEPGKTANYRETVTIEGPDHFVFRSSIETGGQWVEFYRMDYRRKAPAE